MFDTKTVHPQSRKGVRGGVLHVVHHPTRGASLVTGALVVGAVVGGRAGYRVGNAISHRHDDRSRA